MDAPLTESAKLPAINPQSKLEWLRSGFANLAIDPVGVDRETNTINGFVVAEEGPFFNEWRGEFDKEGLSKIAALINAHPNGVKSRFTHPTMSDDGLGHFLGRVRNARLAETINRKGETVACVRADLHFDSTALDTPPKGGKPLGLYVMDLAESDPDAISSSVVVKRDEAYRINPDGTRKKGPNNEELPPLWKPLEIHASDIVDEGDAVGGLLSADTDRFPYWKGAELLNKVFPGASRQTFHNNLQSFLKHYENLRFGESQLAADSMKCPECGAMYGEDSKYCSECGAKLQKSKPHGDENMSDKQPVKPDSEKEKPEKLTAEQAELVRLREESAKKDDQIAELSTKLSEVEPLAGKVESLTKQIGDLNAKNDKMELASLLDGDLFHKWRTEERPKLAAHLLKLKAVSEELYLEGLEEVKNRADVKPRLNQVAGHVQDQGPEQNRDQKYEALKTKLRTEYPSKSEREITRLAQAHPEFKQIAQGGK